MLMPFATASRRQGVDGLDLLHLLAGQAVALHGDEGGRPSDHRDDTEQDDDDHIHTGGVRIVLGRQALQADEADRHTDNGGGQAGNQLVNQAEQRTHDAGDVLAGLVRFVVRAVGDHRDGHIRRSIVRTVADAEQQDEQNRVQVDRQSALTQQAQAEGCAVLLPEHQQDKHAHIAHQRHADIAHQAGFLTFFLARAHGQQEEAEH